MEYRLHCLDEDRCILSIHQINSADDLAALAEAEMRCADNAVEIWKGLRYVARVKKGNVPLDAADRMSL